MAQLYFYYSAMNAGKSTALLQSSYNYQERGMRTVVYTAEIDDRFGAGKVSSRIGLSSPARLYNPQTSLFDDIAAEHQLKPIHCVLVDESQFLTREQVHELSEVVDTLDIPVLYAVPGIIWLLLKMAFFFFVFSWVKATVPRYRYDQIMRLGWKVFLPVSLIFVFLVSGFLMLTRYGGAA